MYFVIAINNMKVYLKKGIREIKATIRSINQKEKGGKIKSNKFHIKVSGVGGVWTRIPIRRGRAFVRRFEDRRFMPPF